MDRVGRTSNAHVGRPAPDGPTIWETTMSDTTTLYRYSTGSPALLKVGEFRTVAWCTAHDSQLEDNPELPLFVCLQARAWRHHAPKNDCKFVDKLVEA